MLNQVVTKLVLLQDFLDNSRNQCEVKVKVFNIYKISIVSVLLATPLCVFPLRILAQTSNAEQPAVILNSGSTNTCNYRIRVLPSGKATYTVCNRKGAGEIKVNTATKFFNDISAAKPLSKLPYKPCGKSVSFGTSTQVRYQGQKSPDVSCPSNDLRVTNLYDDAKNVQQELNFSTAKNQLSN
ncbi:MAG: hypothetical protein ACYTXA_00820 [Nostoc sp.]